MADLTLETLAGELHRLFPLPPDASREFSRKRELLQVHMRDRLMSLDSIHELTGYHLVTDLLDSHRNHVNLMANVFEYDLCALLVQTIPRMHLASLSRGFSREYFTVELSAWRDAAAVVLCPESAGAVIPVYQWIIDHHDDLVSAARKSAAGAPPSGGTPWDSMAERFLKQLVWGNTRECLSIASEIASTDQLMPFFRHVVQPAMHEIGLMWERGVISVSQEHAASSIVGRVMSSLYASFARPHPTKGRAVVGAVTCEYHELGAWIISDMLELDGWEVRYLGANTPPGDMLTILERFSPHIFALSVTMPFNLEHASRIISAMRENPRTAQIAVLAGGIAINMSPGLWKTIGADGSAPDVEGAVELAAQLWERLPADRRQ